MTKAVLVEKIRKIEGELQVLKKVVAAEPDFSIDEKNWAKAKGGVKQVRKSRYQKLYGEK